MKRKTYIRQLKLRTSPSFAVLLHTQNPLCVTCVHQRRPYRVVSVQNVNAQHAVESSRSFQRLNSFGAVVRRTHGSDLNRSIKAYGNFESVWNVRTHLATSYVAHSIFIRCVVQCVQKWRQPIGFSCVQMYIIETHHIISHQLQSKQRLGQLFDNFRNSWFFEMKYDFS